MDVSDAIDVLNCVDLSTFKLPHSVEAVRSAAYRVFRMYLTDLRSALVDHCDLADCIDVMQLYVSDLNDLDVLSHVGYVRLSAALSELRHLYACEEVD